MMEEFAWEFFSKTGSFESYLLYKESLQVKENSGDYGLNQNQRCGHQADQGERQ